MTGEAYPVEPDRRSLRRHIVTAGIRPRQPVYEDGEWKQRFGRITELTQRTRRSRSPLERELDNVTRLVAALSVLIGVLFFVVAGALGMGLSDRFVFAIGVMVALVPEGLLPTVTLSLALATQRMARRHALVRRLSSVETLGETTVICTDKTGTLTENQMTVQRIWTPAGFADVEGTGYEPFGRFHVDDEVVDPERFVELLRAGLLCNDARLTQTEADWSVLETPLRAPSSCWRRRERYVTSKRLGAFHGSPNCLSARSENG